MFIQLITMLTPLTQADTHDGVKGDPIVLASRASAYILDTQTLIKTTPQETQRLHEQNENN